MSLPDPQNSVNAQPPIPSPFPEPRSVPANQSPVPGPPQEVNPMMGFIMPIGVSGVAIAAGYAGLFAVLLLPAPLALALGIWAIFHVHKSGKKGMGRAIFGLIAGAIGTLLLIVIALSQLSGPSNPGN